MTSRPCAWEDTDAASPSTQSGAAAHLDAETQLSDFDAASSSWPGGAAAHLDAAAKSQLIEVCCCCVREVESETMTPTR